MLSFGCDRRFHCTYVCAFHVFVSYNEVASEPHACSQQPRGACIHCRRCKQTWLGHTTTGFFSQEHKYYYYFVALKSSQPALLFLKPDFQSRLRLLAVAVWSQQVVSERWWKADENSGTRSRNGGDSVRTLTPAIVRGSALLMCWRSHIVTENLSLSRHASCACVRARLPR